MIESLHAKKEIKTEKNYNELAKYLVKRLNVSTKISTDHNHFNDFTKRLEIKIPEKMVKKIGSQSLKGLNGTQVYNATHESFFWVEQSLNTLKKFPNVFGMPLMVAKLRYNNPPKSIGLLHFYPRINLLDITEYGKTKVKIYFISCLLRFINELKEPNEDNKLNCPEFEVLTNPNFEGFLFKLGFKKLDKSRVVAEAKIGAKITHEDLLELEPKLYQELAKYLKKKDEQIQSNNGSRKTFEH
jgi:hypothetical protein